MIDKVGLYPYFSDEKGHVSYRFGPFALGVVMKGHGIVISTKDVQAGYCNNGILNGEGIRFSHWFRYEVISFEGLWMFNLQGAIFVRYCTR